LLIADCVVLVWIGQRPVENPYIFLGQLASLYFFIYFLVFIPILGKFEPFLVNYKNNEIKTAPTSLFHSLERSMAFLVQDRRSLPSLEKAS
jgi:ubiquinol-cytochrome c reductase cytochrome b subunit